MSTDIGLRRLPSRIDPVETYVSLVALARELEQSQQLTVALQLAVEDLEERVELSGTLVSWMATVVTLLAIIAIAAVVYAFSAVRLP